jgi:cytochrome c-type biogenesis protein CcmH
MNSHASRVLAAIVLAMLAMPLLAAPALAASCQRTSLADIDDEVMCPICGTPLGAAGGPQAEDQREFIRERVERCQTKQEIKNALVAEYGREVLALPESRGFNKAVYIVPAAALVLAAGLLAFAARGWRRDRTADAALSDTGSAPLDDDRLRSDMDKYEL